MKKYYIWLPVMGTRSSITTIHAESVTDALQKANVNNNYVAQTYDELPSFMKKFI